MRWALQARTRGQAGGRSGDEAMEAVVCDAGRKRAVVLLQMVVGLRDGMAWKACERQQRERKGKHRKPESWWWSIAIRLWLVLLYVGETGARLVICTNMDSVLKSLCVE